VDFQLLREPTEVSFRAPASRKAGEAVYREMLGEDVGASQDASPKMICVGAFFVHECHQNISIPVGIACDTAFPCVHGSPLQVQLTDWQVETRCGA
jgi:hypothetical protein